MSVYETLRPLPNGSITIFRVVSAFEAVTSRLTAWSRARRTASQLRQLSDSQLRDVGLTRGQIANVASGLAAR